MYHTGIRCRWLTLSLATTLLSLFTFVLFAQLAHALIKSPPKIVKQPPPDEILFQVATQQNENDKPFIIECEAEANPQPTYHWMKNGLPYEYQVYDNRITKQEGRGSLIITSPRDDDMGQYQCFASNQWGNASSNSVYVRKAELNSFKDEPAKTLEAKEGDPFKLTCTPPDGWPKPNVYWLIQNSDGAIRSINNSRITLDPEGNLWFSNVTRQDSSDEFTYACSAMSVFRNEYKLGNKIALHVVSTSSSPGQNKHEPVPQYVSRRNEVALRGKKIQLYCIYGGTPLPDTKWSKNGKTIIPSERVSMGNYGKSLIIKHINFTDEGDYTCEVSNGVGVPKTHTIKLQVKAIPYFLEEPESVNAAEEEDVEFRCTAFGVPPPQIQWIYNTKPISLAPRNDRRHVYGNKIVIEKLQPNDTGNYGCNATNELGYVYKDVFVNVIALAPEINEAPQDVETVDSQTVVMTCRVFGSPKPQVKWIRNGVELTGGRYLTLENGDLQISNVAFTDMGQYTCHARNKLGEASSSANLAVKQRTVIKQGAGPVDYEVKAGEPATFRCSPEQDESLRLTVDWKRNGELINFESEPRFIITKDHSLTITKTTELDSGVYTCVASTPLDEANSSATLIVQDAPNPPELISITCNQKDAMILWKPQGDNRAPILNYIIQYNTSFTPYAWDIAFDSVPSSESSYTVPITPWANYTFRVLAKNKIGISLPSGHSAVCRTEPDVPYKNPDNVEAEGTAHDNMVIKWTPMPMIEHHAPRFEYVVTWRRDVPGDQWNTEHVNDWRQSELKITNLPTFQKYIVKVTAKNERGEANVAAKEVVGYSGEDVPSQAPTNVVAVGEPTAKSVTLTWNGVPKETLNGHFKGYKVQIWTDEEGDAGIKEMEIRANTTSALIDKLIPNSVNKIRILAFNGRYNGPPSEVITVVTPEGVPDAVQTLEAIPISSSAFMLLWKPPLQVNGNLTGYRIYYQTVKGTYLGPLLERDPQILDPKQTQAKLAGLEVATKYRIHINATTKAGEGAGFSIEARTKGTSNAPLETPDFRYEIINAHNDIYPSLKIWWMPPLGPEKRSGSHFYVKYRVKGRTMFEETRHELNEDYLVIRGLDPGETYETIVVSVDGTDKAESYPQDIEMTLSVLYSKRKENMLLAGWFIGMLMAISFLLILLFLVCVMKRKRGGKYMVHEREAASGRRDYPDDAGFDEYAPPLRGMRPAQRNSNPPLDSDSDSMAEVEGDAEGMNEDGSFIGQYGKKKTDASSAAAFATLV